MKVFVSYAFTGEDEAALTKRLSAIRHILNEIGADWYINIYDPKYQTMVDTYATDGDYVRVAMEELKTCDTVLVINTSERRSEGSLMETGAALALGKRIVFAQHVTSSGKTYIPTLADGAFVWEDEGELLEKIQAALVR